MNASLPFILISISVIVIVAVLFFFVSKNRNENRLTPLAGLAFGFILAGILFGEVKVLGYGLMGVGVIIALIDIINGARRK
jgi:amino acid transporter